MLLFSSAGENEVWYYSSKYQFEELMECLDGTKWEFILVKAIEDVREDIIKQMDTTEKLTNDGRGMKSSILHSENSEYLSNVCVCLVFACSMSTILNSLHHPVAA
jgi:nucleosome-remodeling factor subunit BPTF